jgi:hypothetical protein
MIINFNPGVNMLRSKLSIILSTSLLLSSLTARAYQSVSVDFAKYCMTGVISTDCDDQRSFDPNGSCGAVIALEDRITRTPFQQRVYVAEGGSWSRSDGKTASIITLGVLAPPTLASSSFSHSSNTASSNSQLNEILDSYKKLYRCGRLAKAESDDN